MDGYELTDRGKITIAVVVAIVLIALSMILVVKTLAARPPQQPDEQNPTASGTQPPAITETIPPVIQDSPPPTGGGLIPTDATPGASPNVSPPGASPDTTPGASPNVSPPGASPDTMPGASPNVSPPSASPDTTPGASPNVSPPPPEVTHEGSPSDSPLENPGSIVDTAEGTLSFHYSPESQNTLDSETTSLLGAFLRSPKNTRDNYIIIELPKQASEDTEKLVAAIVSAFAAQGIREQRLAFTMTSSDASAGVFEVNIYYMASQVK